MLSVSALACETFGPGGLEAVGCCIAGGRGDLDVFFCVYKEEEFVRDKCAAKDAPVAWYLKGVFATP